jgi:lipid-A-disaccharide synthase-like uncharacterized protein
MPNGIGQGRSVTPRLSWKASLAGAMLLVTIIYAAAQMGSGQVQQGADARLSR